MFICYLLFLMNASFTTPIPYLIGFTLWFNIDNGNIVYLLLILILFPIIYWINGLEAKTIKSILLFVIISFILFIAFSLINLILFFICYELIIITLFILLLLFIPSYYRVRTSFFFFLFSIVGSIFFIISCILFVTNSFILLLVLVIPFLIKLPCFLFIIDYQKYIVKLIHQYHYYLLVYY